MLVTCLVQVRKLGPVCVPKKRGPPRIVIDSIPLDADHAQRQPSPHAKGPAKRPRPHAAGSSDSKKRKSEEKSGCSGGNSSVPRGTVRTRAAAAARMDAGINQEQVGDDVQPSQGGNSSGSQGDGSSHAGGEENTACSGQDGGQSVVVKDEADARRLETTPTQQGACGISSTCQGKGMVDVKQESAGNVGPLHTQQGMDAALEGEGACAVMELMQQLVQGAVEVAVPG